MHSVFAGVSTSRTPTRAACLVLFSAAFFPGSVLGQATGPRPAPEARAPAGAAAGSPAAASQARAVAVVQAGIEAMGGRALLDGLEALSFRVSLERRVLGQELTPGGEPLPARPGHYRVTLDLASGTLTAESFQTPAAPEPAARLVLGPKGGFLFMPAQEGLEEIQESDLPQWSWFREEMVVAPILLKEVARRSETLRYLGTEGEGPEAVEVVTYSDEKGAQRTLSFARSTGLLVRAEEVTDHPQKGDVSTATRFLDYREGGGLMFPRRMTVTVGEEERSQLTLDMPVLNPREVTALIARPEGAKVLDRVIPAATARRTAELAPGIHQVFNIKTGYNLLYVEFDKEVVVIEPLGGVEATRSLLQEIQTLYPDKPVTSVVVTHHHGDHTDGLLPYLEAGISVYATPGIVDFVRSVAAAPRGLATAGPLPEPTIRLVEGSLIVGSGPNRFQLIDMGPNPHAQEILVAYFPEHLIMYVPDIYGYGPGFTPPPLLLSFADRFDEMGLAVATFATAHTDPTTLEEYQSMVAAARAQAEGGGR